MHIWFELKDTKNPTAIRIVISVGGQKIKKDTGLKINPSSQFWNNGYPRNILQNKALRYALDDLKSELEKFGKDVFLQGKAPTPFMVKEQLLKIIAGRTAPDKTFHDIMEEFISDRSEELAVGTMKAYRSMSNHIKGFQAKNKVKLTLEDINAKLGNDLKKYLLAEGLQNPTIKKVFTHLRGFAQWAFENKYSANKDYVFIKQVKVKEQGIVVLDIDELKQLENYIPKTESMRRVKDFFLFTCYTGLRYGDLHQVKRENIIFKKGKQNLSIRFSQKNQKKIALPIVPKAKSILEKYDYNLNPISNQKLNEYIKVLIKEAGINSTVELIDQRGAKFKSFRKKKYDVISIHDGRKTFISHCLSKGVETSLAMKLSTHSGYHSFKRYVEFSEKDMREQIEKVFE